MKVAYAIEKNLYKNAAKIIFTMEGGKDYIIQKGWDKAHNGPVNMEKIYYINNGVDLRDFDSNAITNKIQDSDLEDTESFNVIYLGSIRLVNNLKNLIDAAALLKDYKKIRFLIYGDGTEREYLIDYCNNNHIQNVKFKEKWIPLKSVPYILSCSSLNILNYKPNDIARYGGSQGKLFQYLAAGKPICSNIKMGYCPINKYNLGIAKNFNTPQEYADAIFSLAQLDQVAYAQMCERVKNVAKEFDYAILSEKLIEVLK